MHDDGISKTKRKQQMHALQDIGKEVVGLSEQQIAQLDLPETLADAVLDAKRLKSHEALRRQLQYIGRLMRDVDVAPIQAKLDAWKGVSQEETARLHHIERWRDRLLTEPEAVATLIAEHPEADAQHLRNLVRNAQKEAAAGRPPKSSRALFRTLRDLFYGTTNPVSSPADEDDSERSE